MRHHTVQVPATTANLGPGFDAFGLALQRYLVVRTVDVDSQPDRVRIADDDTSELACDDDNLVWRSFVRFCDHHEVPVPDVGLVCSSQIPLERGLGSSSSAIVAGLTLARALTEIRCSDRDLVALAAGIEGHPDNVAPAVLGGLVVCASDDDGRLVVRRINPATASRPLILVPSDRSDEAQEILSGLPFEVTTDPEVWHCEPSPRGKRMIQIAIGVILVVWLVMILASLLQS
jgi:homoserine kinase